MIKNYRYTFAISLFLLSVAAASWAHAQERRQTRIVLDCLDQNHDGKLSTDEIKAAPTRLLTLDRTGDGQLTADELTPRPENAGAAPNELVQQLMSFDKAGRGYLLPGDVPERMQGLFQRADADHDGKLTPDEIRALSARQGMPAGAASSPGRAAGMFRIDPLLNALDSNHDGLISAGEIAAAVASLQSLDNNADGELTADEIRVRQQTPEERANHMLEEWDTDKDGKITRAEAPERMAQQFDAIDKNSDGFLEKDELIEYLKQQGSQPRNEAPHANGATPPTH